MKQKITILLLLILPFTLKATHIVGGEFSLQYKEGNTYTLRLNLYFDLVNGNAGARDPEATIHIYSKNGDNLMDEYTLPLIRTESVEYTNPECQTPSLQTELLIYELDIELTPDRYNDLQGYYVVWERCCRNDIITNIINSGDAGMVFYLEFPPVVRDGSSFINSSPVFGKPKGDYVCANQPFFFEFGATDPDGDDLVYSLVTPLNGYSTPTEPAPLPEPAPYPTITWAAGFSATNAIQGSPPLQIDANTGQLSVTASPTSVNSLFVFSVLCEEFRNGNKIGEIRRDYQLLVLDCPDNELPSIFVKEKDKDDFYAEDQTILIKAEGEKCIEIWMTDPDIGDDLTVKIDGLNFDESRRSFFENNGGTITSSNDTIKIELCWPECFFTEFGAEPFEFNLWVEDDACPTPGTDTIKVTLRAEPEENYRPVVSTDYGASFVSMLVDESIDFNVLGYDADNDFIRLSAEGRDFDLASVGMVFNPTEGTGNVQSPFSWTPTCQAFETGQRNFIIDFFLIEEGNCKDTLDIFTFIIELDEEEVNIDVFEPYNVITPNNDGKNDTYTLPNLPEENCTFQFVGITIYNRWGVKVYESKERNFAWDAKNFARGIYYYYIDYKGKKYKGSINLLK